MNWFRLMGDILAAKVRRSPTNTPKSIHVPNLGTVSYRRNKGDLWSLREVILDECYRFPRPLQPRVLIDLGANIGLTSLWLSHAHKLSRIVAVEPDPSNLELARQNLSQLKVEVTLVAGAVGAEDGFASFGRSELSNMGAMAYNQPGHTRVISMPTLLKENGIVGTIDLLKIDIEGGEADLFSKNLDWLGQVDAIIAEFHPTVIDVEPILTAICSQGFVYIPPHSVFKGNMGAFVRSKS
jgi:FkbM family methyltransferase